MTWESIPFWATYGSVVLAIFAAVLVPHQWICRAVTLLIRLPDLVGWARCVIWHKVAVSPLTDDDRWSVTTCSCGRAWTWRIRWEP